MGLKHPAIYTRDVGLFLPFRKTMRSRQALSLPQLIQQFMNRKIGGSFENPVRINFFFPLAKIVSLDVNVCPHLVRTSSRRPRSLPLGGRRLGGDGRPGLLAV
jgi:hypothetical protein